MVRCYLFLICFYFPLSPSKRCQRTTLSASRAALTLRQPILSLPKGAMLCKPRAKGNRNKNHNKACHFQRWKAPSEGTVPSADLLPGCPRQGWPWRLLSSDSSIPIKILPPGLLSTCKRSPWDAGDSVVLRMMWQNICWPSCWVLPLFICYLHRSQQICTNLPLL